MDAFIILILCSILLGGVIGKSLFEQAIVILKGFIWSPITWYFIILTPATLQMDASIVLILCAILLGGVIGKSLSEQAIVTLKSQNGQLYDCVNFYKQPAFSHPSLKNHIPKVRLELVQSRRSKGVGLKNGGCPYGTVPILRVNTTTRDDPRHASPPVPQHCNAVIQTNLGDSNRKFYGSNAALSIYKPSVGNSQWSSARIKFINGKESIEAGWMVNPNIFNDNEAHLYALFTVTRGGCINLACPGFVQVSQDVPLGIIPDQYSVIGGTQYTWNISIEKHSEDDHWWLMMTEENKYALGYWPRNIFTSIADVANQIEWGGEINNLGEDPLPQMGNGRKATYDTASSACLAHVTVNTESDQNVEPQGTQKVKTCPNQYTVLDAGYRGDYWGRLMYYGGYLNK